MITYLMLLMFVLILCEAYNIWLQSKLLGNMTDLLGGILDELENIKWRIIKND